MPRQMLLTPMIISSPDDCHYDAVGCRYAIRRLPLRRDMILLQASCWRAISERRAFTRALLRVGDIARRLQHMRICARWLQRAAFCCASRLYAYADDAATCLRFITFY